MSSSLVRGKYLVAKVIDSEKSQIIPDGALYQEDGEIVAVGSYSNIKAALYLLSLFIRFTICIPIL